MNIGKNDRPKNVLAQPTEKRPKIHRSKINVGAKLNWQHYFVPNKIKEMIFMIILHLHILQFSFQIFSINIVRYISFFNLNRIDPPVMKYIFIYCYLSHVQCYYRIKLKLDNGYCHIYKNAVFVYLFYSKFCCPSLVSTL